LNTLKDAEAVDAPSQEAWLAERARWAASVLRDCVEIDPQKRSGVPVLKGSRFTVAQMFAELAEGRSIVEIAENFDLDLEIMKQLLQGFSANIDRPMSK
jgi:uncharacterized protein (DUF433 family)